MAEPAPSTSTPAPAKDKAGGPPSPAKSGGLKPDVATLAGIVLALAGILGGLLLEKGSIQDVAQATAAMIVFGGTIGAVLITNPLPVFLRACKALGQVFFERSISPAGTIQTVLQMATKARKNGIVSLENEEWVSDQHRADRA